MISKFLYATIVLLFFCQCVLYVNGNTVKSKDKGKYNYIYIIRHGEKTSDSDFGLSPIGFEHAHCLVKYFKHFPFGAPKYSITKISATQRPVETTTIIANKLDIGIEELPNDMKLFHVSKYIKDKLNNYNPILVVWENNEIPIIARNLGCKKCKSWNYDPRSRKHDPKLYNSTWVLRYDRINNYNNFYDFDQNFSNNICLNDTNYYHRTFK
jgi:hypothetical protein